MSKLTLVIGNKNYSSWSLRAWLFLRFHNIAFTEKRIPLDTDTTSEQLAGYRSGFKVPVLVDDGFEVWDSLAILEYLSEKYLDGKGWPADENARAVARSVSAEMHSSFVHVRGEMPMNCRRRIDGVRLSAQAEQEIERIEWLWAYCRENFGSNIGAGDQGCLFGRFSIADAMFAPVALRFHGYGISLAKRSEQYLQTILNDACIREWVQAASAETEVLQREEIEVDRP